MVRMLHRQFLVPKDSSICSNVSSLSDRRKLMSFWMLMMVWTTIMNEVHAVFPLSSHYLLAFFKLQLKVKIRLETGGLSSWDITDR